jgi:hypothetical protein
MSKNKTKNSSKNTEESEVKSSSSSNSIIPIYRPEQIDVNAIEFSELNDEYSQISSFLTYNNPKLNTFTKLLFQTGFIVLNAFGIPQLDKDRKNNKGVSYFPDDSKRDFIRVPIDPAQKACVELEDFLEKVDELYGSEKIRKKLFGKRAKEYSYVPCIRSPQNNQVENDDNEEGSDNENNNDNIAVDGNNSNIKKFVKLKFNSIKTNSNSSIITSKLKKIIGDEKVIVDAKTMTEVANELTFFSKCRFLIHMQRLWANKTPYVGTKIIPYGISFKIAVVEYYPSTKSSINFKNIDFISDNENSDDEKSSKNKKIKSDEKKKSKFDDSDNDSEEEKPIKKSDKKTKSDEKKKSKFDDSDNDSEEEKPIKKNDKKVKSDEKKKSKFDDSDNDSEEETNKKKKQAKKYESEEESEEEEIKPKKKKNSKSKINYDEE